VTVSLATAGRSKTQHCVLGPRCTGPYPQPTEDQRREEALAGLKTSAEPSGAPKASFGNS
jgi:hypothetical protein